jgi:uncharacterized membrane protein YidH (DUF202 family)
MKEILMFLWKRRTTALGYVVVVLGVLATSRKFTQETVEWFLLIIGVVTAVLGHHNNSQVKAAERAKAAEEEQ